MIRQEGSAAALHLPFAYNAAHSSPTFPHSTTCRPPQKKQKVEKEKEVRHV